MFFFLITKLSFPLAIFSLFFHFQLFKSLVIWNSFVRINGNIWYLSIHVWTTLMLSQAKLDIWLPRVYEDDGDCAGGDFLEHDHQHHRHDQHIWHLNVSQGWHTELHPTHLIRVASHLVVWNKIKEETPAINDWGWKLPGHWCVPKKQKPEFWHATNPSGFHRLYEPPKKFSIIDP